ncbi:hypothetical protein BOX15_Mlig001217g1 [Macrostomum lignano]|uniref:Uncharacterized protein n=1 Tax=Macrostomum lignano TaxID=282301 RepID=A0A267GRD5_9PLAT|nr:hypothetical protein BOX15_Mlig001217g1 [Macrostomum lignano]
MTAAGNHQRPPNSSLQRSILKTPDSSAASSASSDSSDAADVTQPADTKTSRQQAAARVEICEHRNKLIFYRQDTGWRVGYFAEHRNRHARHSVVRSQQQPLMPFQPGRRVTYPTAAGDGPPMSIAEARQATLPERSSSPESRPPVISQSRQMSVSDLDISVRVIHACTNGCFSINS